MTTTITITTITPSPITTARITTPPTKTGMATTTTATKSPLADQMLSARHRVADRVTTVSGALSLPRRSSASERDREEKAARLELDQRLAQRYYQATTAKFDSKYVQLDLLIYA